ncbi:MAG: transcriptional regulator, MerR family [Actinoallomurus sp.]|nr:transcriptional regulator, MerR family [Actinoallomurus sp.]
MDPFGDDSPVYVISVAAELSGLHPQTLRTYDRMGLVSPGRASGRGRRYSMRDIVLLREIQRLSQDEGINLAGIRQILDLQREAGALSAEVVRLRGLVEDLGNELESTRAVAARLARLKNTPESPGGAELVPIRQTSVVVWRSRGDE